MVRVRPYLFAIATSLLGLGCGHPHNSLSEIASPNITVLGLQKLQVTPDEVVPAITFGIGPLGGTFDDPCFELGAFDAVLNGVEATYLWGGGETSGDHDERYCMEMAGGQWNLEQPITGPFELILSDDTASFRMVFPSDPSAPRSIVPVVAGALQLGTTVEYNWLPATDALPAFFAIEIDPAGTTVAAKLVRGQLTDPSQNRFELALPSQTELDYAGEAELTVLPGRIELPVDACEGAVQCSIESEANPSVSVQITP
jgi:hypothetical protein